MIHGFGKNLLVVAAILMFRHQRALGITKKITFTTDGRIITYKNNIEIRNSTYELKKGISVIDNLEHDLISFEGSTYVI